MDRKKKLKRSKLGRVEDRLMNSYKVKQQRIAELRREKTEGLFQPKKYTSNYRSRTPIRNSIVEKTFGFSAKKGKHSHFLKSNRSHSPMVTPKLLETAHFEPTEKGRVQQFLCSKKANCSENDESMTRKADTYLKQQGRTHITSEELELFLNQEEKFVHSKDQNKKPSNVRKGGATLKVKKKVGISDNKLKNSSCGVHLEKNKKSHLQRAQIRGRGRHKNSKKPLKNSHSRSRSLHRMKKPFTKGKKKSSVQSNDNLIAEFEQGLKKCFQNSENRADCSEKHSECQNLQELNPNKKKFAPLLDQESINLTFTSNSKKFRKKDLIQDCAMARNSDLKYFAYKRFESGEEDEFIFHEDSTKREAEEELESQIHESLLEEYPIPERVNSKSIVNLEHLKELNEKFTLKEIINLSNKLIESENGPSLSDSPSKNIPEIQSHHSKVSPTEKENAFKACMVSLENCKQMETITSYCSNRPPDYDSNAPSYQTSESFEPYPEVDLRKKVHHLFNRDHLSLKKKELFDRNVNIGKIHDGEWSKKHEFKELGVQNDHFVF